MRTCSHCGIELPGIEEAALPDNVRFCCRPCYDATVNYAAAQVRPAVKANDEYVCEGLTPTARWKTGRRALRVKPSRVAA